jgi:peptide/nickel transport system substrate-binding protein
MKTKRLGLTIASLTVALSTALAACNPASTPVPGGGQTSATETPSGQPAATATAPAAEATEHSEATPTEGGAVTPGGSTPGAGSPERVPADQLPMAPPKGVTSKKDTLVFAMSQEPSSLFALFESAAVAQVAAEPIFDGLINRDAKDDLYPEIAWYVPTLENGGAYWVGEGADRHLAVKYELRPGIKWSDGQEITSADALFTYKLILDPNSTIQDRTLWEKVHDVETPDKYIVIFNFMSGAQAADFYEKASAEQKDHFAFLKPFADQKLPVVDPLYNLVGASIYPEHVLGKIPADKITESSYARDPIGSGPFKVERWDAGSQIVLTRNPNYNLTDKPLLKTIVIKIINDTNQIISQLKTGDLDAATSDAFPAPTQVLDTLASSGQQVEYVPARQWEHIDFNLDRPFFQEKEVRQAIAYAINRDNLVAQVLLGKSIVLNTFLPPVSWASLQNQDVAAQLGGQFKLNDYKYDPNKANQMLDAAGWVKGADGIRAKNGVKLSFDYATTAGNKLREQVTQLVQADLKKVGIDARLKYVPSDVYFADDGYLAKREHDFAQYAWVLDADPSGSLYDSQYVPSEANNYSGANYPGYKNDRYDQLSRAASNELQRSKRVPLFAEMQQIWNDDLPTVPLFTRLNIEVHKQNLANWQTSAGTTYPTYMSAAMYFK